MLTFKHSGCIGDVIWTLPVIRYHGGGHLFLAGNMNPFTYNGRQIHDFGVKKGMPRSIGYENGKSVIVGHKDGLSSVSIQMLIPLLLKQEYITKASIWNNESVTTDLDGFRLNPLLKRRKNLSEFILDHFSVPVSELRTSWLVADKLHMADFVFHFTERWRNIKAEWYVKKILKIHNKSSVFVGYEHEWKEFCRNFGKIDFHKVSDFLEMASIINGAKFFVGNQSCGNAMAIALGKSCFQMVASNIRDCIFVRKHHYYLGLPDKNYIGVL